MVLNKRHMTGIEFAIGNSAHDRAAPLSCQARSGAAMGQGAVLDLLDPGGASMTHQSA